ncbi:bi-domain-containing oxidoreductase [Cohnella boryungensis]|uniref:Bi-domain-containing oxidoreductase n=1 Tax=Cohnella boryungensis TaxID=768479 RepID=A0ABV8S8L9_9BACL
MKQVIIRGGTTVVEEVPAPVIESGRLLVQVNHSCISIGTEMSGVRNSGLPLWKRAMQQPEQVKKVLQMIKDQGLGRTRSLVKGKLAAGNATGYSASGIVLEVGDGIQDIKPGDRVACAGAECAHHAEVISVPRNLSVKIPDSVEFSEASMVTLGAIALQGVRRASPTIGETFVVIGLGILGQIAVQILKANGCKVIGVDLDPKRVALAEKMGLDLGVYPDKGNDISTVFMETGGYGADGVIITAATPSNAVVSNAFQMCRKKGRVVLVGDVGLNLNRADFYQKELDFFISSSYGPGRYDYKYEEKGMEYPIGYVRWTENRNMGEIIRLIQSGKLQIKPLIHKTYPIDEAPAAYNELKNSADKPLMVLLSYPERKDVDKVRIVQNPLALPSHKQQIKVAIAGAGGFAKGMHLPNLQKLSSTYHLQSIMSRTGHNSIATSKQFGAMYATTDYKEILADSEVDLVLITTRHNLHASMALEALKAGKHVLVEKPLVLSQTELSQIEDYFRGNSEKRLPILMTGYNRRFSPHMQRVKQMLSRRTNPFIMNYRMNAGYIPLDHWVHTEEGGGRNLGEACHIYDLFVYLADSKPIKIHAHSIQPRTDYYAKTDNFVTVVTFEDGSVATLTYTALGNKEYAKEQMDLFVDGQVIVLDDYRTLKAVGTKQKGIEGKLINKGQLEELQALANSITSGGEWPIPLWQQLEVSRISLEVERQIKL